MSHKNRGLTQDEVAESHRLYGDNRLEKKKSRSFFAAFLSNLGDPVIKILIGAMVLNIVFMFRRADWIETVGIACSILIATTVSTLSEFGSEAAFRRLSDQCAKSVCRVRRNGTVLEISGDELAVGDTVLLGAGEMIPADGYITKGKISVDQASLTGESHECGKYPSPNGELLPSSPSALFRGCTVLSGSCEMLIEAVGQKTFIGRISGEVQESTRESPLRIRLTKLARQISKFGYIAAILIAVIYLVNVFLLDTAFDKAEIISRITDFPFLFDSLIHALMIGLTVVVMAVPEGLPLMVAVVLSSNIKRMAKSNVLVRKPVGIEAAGSMNILFTDKTGTLTEGIMQVGRIIPGFGQTYDSISDFRHSGYVFDSFVLSCYVNTGASAGYDGNKNLKSLGGNSTDRALLNYALSLDSKPLSLPEIKHKLPFDSSRKLSAAVYGENLYIKGAPDRLLKYINSALLPNGQTKPISQAELVRRLQNFGQGRRCVAVTFASQGGNADDCIKRVANGQIPSLTLICFAVLDDKIRPEAHGAIQRMQNAGIQIVMITGDSAKTAYEIAKECGIINPKVNTVIESSDMQKMSDGQLRKILPSLAVVARALPSDKSRLVKIAESADLVVGMTGDGVNDSPALKLADVGFSMGDGTQVAKDAGDIIILDNNINSIANAVLFGRTIFKSIRKFITVQLMMNFCAVGISMICPFIGIDAPVTMVQMLWINLIMDTLGGLAFAGEAPSDSYMDEAPKRRDEPILNRYMLNQIVLNGSFTIALYIAFLKLPYFASLYRTAPDNIYLLTAFFALFIFSSVFNCFNARTDRLKLLSGIEGNKPFVLIMTAVMLTQLLFVYVGGSVMRTAPLTIKEITVTAALAMTVFPADILRKLLWRVRKQKGGY